MSELRGLDSWITGRYGADAPSERRDDSVEDEGLIVVQRAIDHLQYGTDDDDDEEAIGVLQCSEHLIEREYSCHFCGNWIGNRKDKYCSRSCADADRMGL